MLKKIGAEEIKVGMYIHDLDAAWFDHPFFRKHFHVDNDAVIKKIHKQGLKHVIIDTEKGLDTNTGIPQAEVQRRLHEQCENIAKTENGLQKQIPIDEEIDEAKAVITEANSIVRKLMDDVRLGKQLDIANIVPVTERIINSAFRNKDALISLTRVKNKDEYTFLHSVSVSCLMTTFAHALGFEKERIEQITLGSLLHDIGKIMIPPKVLNKPGKLTDKEFALMKSHVDQGVNALPSSSSITRQAINVVAQHHERIDGTGYPYGLKGSELSIEGQMSTIVDVYDALTSDRCYKKAWEPSIVLKKILEWSPDHFNASLVQQFIRSLGIYPVGTLVKLKSNRVGIVIEQSEQDLLRPRVRVIFHAKQQCYLPVKDIDLARTPQDAILSTYSGKKHNIDPWKFM